jgi:hypothetical protein
MAGSLLKIFPLPYLIWEDGKTKVLTNIKIPHKSHLKQIYSMSSTSVPFWFTGNTYGKDMYLIFVYNNLISFEQKGQVEI